VNVTGWPYTEGFDDETICMEVAPTVIVSGKKFDVASA
jgi:hypothetical protein